MLHIYGQSKSLPKILFFFFQLLFHPKRYLGCMEEWFSWFHVLMKVMLLNKKNTPALI
jgi:hypothetical protein